MQIAQVSPWFSPHLGGVESHVMTLSAKLASRGHEVTVVTARDNPASPPSEVIHGVRVVRVRSRAVLFRTPLAPRIKRVLRGLPADLIHAHSPPPLTSHYASVVARERRLPFVVTYHCDAELASPLGPLVEGFYRRSFGASTLRRADRVIVTTRTYAMTSRTVFRYNPLVVPNAVDDRRFRPDVDPSAFRQAHAVPRDRPVVLLVARIVPHKGIEHFVEAARYVRDAVFLVAGEGSSLAAMRALARSLEVSDRVRFLGRIPEEDLPHLYAACDVFVLPSVSRLEAFGIAALEAMATAKPVVVADIPGLREVIDDGREGLLAEPVNPQDLAEKIRRLLGDPALREEMGRRGREKVLSSFSIDRVTDRIEEIYAAVLASKSGQDTTRSGMRSPA